MPFRGMFLSHFFKNHRYNFSSHIFMGWFSVGCFGLFTANLTAYKTFTKTTGIEAYNMVFILNAVMHGLWGIHNFHIWTRIHRGLDKGTVSEWRRPYSMFFWSIVGACGTATIRNLGAVMYGPNALVIYITWAWEWFSLAVILVDFAYFLAKEHTWGMNMESEESQKALAINDEYEK